jgi:sulfoxide reductase heme-binding subunit YedZ
MAAAAGPAATILGGVAYVFVAAMVATSFDASAAWLGPRRWRLLHTGGLYYLWVVFFVSFAPRVTESALYWPFVLGLLVALVLRWRYGVRPPRALAAAA